MEGPIVTAIDKTSLDHLLAGREPQELFARGGLIDDLKEAFSERMLAAEQEDHLESVAEAAPLDATGLLLARGAGEVTADTMAWPLWFIDRFAGS